MGSDIRCPNCGGKTRLRMSRKDGRDYYVCINYPDCTGKVEAEDDWGGDWKEEGSTTRSKNREAPERKGTTNYLLTISIALIVIIAIAGIAFAIVALMDSDTSISFSTTQIAMAATCLVLGVLGIGFAVTVFGALSTEDAKKPKAKVYRMALAGFALGIIWTMVSLVGIVITIMS